MKSRSVTARLIRAIEAVTSKQYFPIIFLAAITLVAVLAIAPFFLCHRTGEPGFDNRKGMVATHDMANHFGMLEEFYKGLESGVVYPRWFGDANGGYGNALMNFYPPGFYYLTSAIHFFMRDWGNSLMVVSILLFAASGISFCFFARLFMSRLASALASLLFMLFPYHVIDLYQRGAMAELFGFVFIPLIMRFAYRLGAEGRLCHYAGMGLCYGLYLLSHMPVGYLFSYALAFYVVAWAVMSKQFRIILRLGIGMLIGLALGAIYWLPAALEGKHAQEDVSNTHPYDFSYITLLKSEDPFDHLLHAQFILLVLTLLAIIVFLSKTWRAASNGDESRSETSRKSELRTQARLWMMLVVGAAFMSTSFSSYISSLIPKIQASTPAWRWLTVASVFASLLVGLAVDRLTITLRTSTKNMWAWRGTVVASVALNILFSIGLIIGTTQYQKPQRVYDSFSSVTFNPKDAVWHGDIPDMPAVLIEPQADSSEIEAWLPQYRRIRVQLNQPATLRLKIYYFPGWTATVDGQAVPVLQDQYGAQVIPVPAGAHTVEARFGSTPPRAAGAVSSGLAFAAIALMAGADYLRRRRLKNAQPTPATRSSGNH